MATLLEEMETQTLTAEEEAQRVKHNAQINERYRILQNAEADQFAEETPVKASATTYAVRASVLAPERPVVSETPAMEQTPQVTEYVGTRVDSPVFTTEKFNAAKETETVAQVAPVYAPAPVQTPVEMQTPATAASVAVSTETQYGLSAMAKMVLAAFVAVVVAMMAIICVNTQIIQRKSVRLKDLEEQRQELVEEYEEVQRRIEEAKSEETIRAYAQSQGMIQLGE